jgi:hypothetical protein
MNDPKFVNSELKVTASDELEEEVQKELEAECEETSMASILEQESPQNKCCGGGGCQSNNEG